MNAASSVFNMGKEHVERKVADMLSLQLRVIDVEIEARTRPTMWRWTRPAGVDASLFHSNLMWALFALEKAVVGDAPRWEIASHYVRNRLLFRSMIPSLLSCTYSLRPHLD